jgi:hypothetical protein
VRRGAIAGLAVGTLGFAAEYGWSHVGLLLPWGPALLLEGIPTAALAGVAGGVLAALMASALRGRLASVRRPLATAVGAAVVVVALGVNAGIARAPSATATISVTNVHTAVTAGGGRTQVGDVRVRFSRPDLAHDGNWAYVLGWQGGGRFETSLVELPDGSYRASSPVPVGGHWKTFVRIQKGRVLEATAIRMPPDPALHFAGFPARAQVTRPMLADTKLLQIERKNDGPMWAWTPALLLVMTLNLLLMGLIGWGCARSGRLPDGPPSGDARDRPAAARRPVGRLAATGA